MTDDFDISTGRRRFLQIAGTGAALSLAGCGVLQNDGGSGSPSAGEPVTATVLVQPDQEKLSQRRSEIISRAQSDNLSRQNVTRELRRAQQELRSAAMNDFSDRAKSNDSITIEDSLHRYGIHLVSAPPAALVESLSYEEVRALFPASDFEEAKSQNGGTATPAN